MGNSNPGRLRLALVILVLVLFVIAVFGQSGQRVSGHVPDRFIRSGGKITGVVQDSVSGKRIEYANVMLFRLAPVVNPGIITNTPAVPMVTVVVVLSWYMCP